MRTLAVALLISLPALAQEEPASEESSEVSKPASDSPEAVHPVGFEGQKRRAQAFLIPMDEAARAPTTRVAQAIEQVLLRTRRYEVVDLGRAMSVECTAEEAVHADDARKLIAEGKNAAAAKASPEAAAKFQKALQLFDEGLPAVNAHEYAEAVLRFGAASYMAGDDRTAREAFALFARLDPRQKIDPISVEPGVVAEVGEARVQAAAAKHGYLELDARPGGARVTIDGETRGVAPLRAELVPGKHLVRIERSGFYPWSQLVDVTARKTATKSLTLTATPTAASLNQIIAGASDEVTRGGSGKNVLALAQKFSLERIVIGAVRTQADGRATVLIALVDARGQKVLGQKSFQVTADGTDADQIETDTQDLMSSIIAGDREDGAPAEPAQVAPPVVSPPVVSERRMVMPGSAPAAPMSDDSGLLVHRAPAQPIDPAPADAPPPKPAEPVQKKKKTNGIRNKTGMEDWDNDSSSADQPQK